MIKTDKINKINSGKDFIIGSLILMCIIITKNIKKAIPKAESCIISGIHKPTIRPIEKEHFKKPTV